MTELSPAAQAVLDAYGDFEAANVDAMAAALRALAHNVHSDEIVTCGGSSYALVIERDDIRAIADELEAQ
jgi:glycine/serine hydroxymethyltransferase